MNDSEQRRARRRGKNHQAYLWQHSRPGNSVVFDFGVGREREGPKRFLGDFEGILQTDGYTGLLLMPPCHQCYSRASIELLFYSEN